MNTALQDAKAWGGWRPPAASTARAWRYMRNNIHRRLPHTHTHGGAHHAAGGSHRGGGALAVPSAAGGLVRLSLQYDGRAHMWRCTLHNTMHWAHTPRGVHGCDNWWNCCVCLMLLHNVCDGNTHQAERQSMQQWCLVHHNLRTTSHSSCAPIVVCCPTRMICCVGWLPLRK